MSYTERQIAFENQGQKLYGFLHVPEGAGPYPAVALLHGFGGNHIEPHALFPKAARTLAAAGVAALRFDFRGSGDSEGDFRDVTLEGEVDDAHAGLDFLAEQPEVDASRLGLLGLSLGGLVTACTASTRPDLRAIALWSAVAHLGELFALSTTPEQQQQLVAQGYVDAGGLAVGLELARQATITDPVTAVTSYDGPVLVAHGTDDQVVPVEHAYRYKAALGDRAELRIIEGADHVYSRLSWERMLIDATVDWFRRHLPRA